MSKLTKLEKSWIYYDMGNSAFSLLCTTLIPIYFKNMARQAGITDANSTAYLSYMISLSTVIMMVVAPLIGAMADNKGRKKPWFLMFVTIGVAGLASLSLTDGWILFLAIYVVARIGFSGSLIFYDAMLVDVTTKERMDEVSSHGFAWGYIGSVIPFVGSLLLVMVGTKAGIPFSFAMGLSFFINAVWWAFSTLPLIKNYRQLYYVEHSEHQVKDSLMRLSGIFHELRKNRRILLFLLSFFLYIDGVYTIIDMATSYGKDVGLNDTSMLLALLLTQVVAFPCALIFGNLTRKFKTIHLISTCILAYFAMTLYALQLDTAFEFWLLASLVGVFQGAIQALSRSYYAKMIPQEKSSEYFGIYDIFGKGAAFVGTMLMGIMTQLFGTSRAGVASIAVIFAIGFFLFQLQAKEW